MKNSDIKPHCQAAKPYYYDYLCGQRDHIPQASSAHIADCPDCQNEVGWLTQADFKAEEFSLQNLHAISHAAQMQLHGELVNQPVRCSTIKSFLPLLAIPEMAVRISTPVTEHIKACEACRKEIETLKQLDLLPEQLSCLSRVIVQHQTNPSEDSRDLMDLFPQSPAKVLIEIKKVINRPDSGIVTYCRSQKGSSGPSEKLFTVEVKQQLPPSARQTRMGASQSRGFFKPAAAAAAILVIALLLFENSAVKATDINQIYEALKNVQQVMMTHHGVDDPKPVQIIWISRSLGIKLYKSDDTFTLYDLHKKKQKIKTPLAETQENGLNRDVAGSIAKTMDVPWGLLPFRRSSEMPQGAVWEKIRLEGSQETEVYDLFWAETLAAGKIINYRWRCHLDPDTKHPLKVEWSEKTADGEDYALTTFTDIHYPSEDQIQQVLDQAGF
jgi:hypothetical protein